MMKNPYLYGYLPFFTVLFFSLTFGIFTVSESMSLLVGIGLYNGMLEFLTDFELRVFLLILFSLCYFMLFSALKLVGTTIHEMGMLFFSKDKEGEAMRHARGANVIFFLGSLLSAAGIQSFYTLVGIFLATVFIYFVFLIFKLSSYMSVSGMIGLMMFEVLFWGVFVGFVIYVLVKLYNSLISALPFI